MRMPPFHTWTLMLFGLMWMPVWVSAEPTAVVTTDCTILEVSEIPDPRTSVYPDCLFTLKIAPYWQDEHHAPVLLILRGYMDRVLTPHADLQPGDRIRVDALPFSEMPPEFQSLRMADSIEDLELRMWAGLSAFRITGDSRSGAGFWTPASSRPENNTRWTPASVSRSAKARRQQILQEEIQRIESLVHAHGGWGAWYGECETYREELRQKAKTSSTGYLVSGQRVLLDPQHALTYPLEGDEDGQEVLLRAMAHLHRQFQLAGTDLIVAPIPMRDEVNAPWFMHSPPADGILQPYRLKLFHDLLVRGIEVVDLLPAYRKHLDHGHTLYHDNTTDGHVSGEGARLTGELLASRLSRYSFETSSVDYVLEPITYVYPGKDVLFQPERSYKAYRVFESNWGRIAQDVNASEILVIGDSMITAPPDIAGASLGLHVMQAAGIPCTFLKRAGSAPQISRFLAREGSPRLFSGRKACIFIFAFDYAVRPHESWAVAPFMEHWMGDAMRPQSISLTPAEPALPPPN